MSADSQIKIGVAIDQSSTNNTLSSVRVIIKEFERLAHTLQAASKSMGSLLGGGAIGGGGQTQGAIIASTPFKGGSSLIAGGPQSNVGGGGGLAAMLNQNSAAFRNLSRETEQFSQALSTNIRRGVNEAKSQLESLKGELEELSGDFNQLSPGAQAGPSGRALAGVIEQRAGRIGGLTKTISDGEKALGGGVGPSTNAFAPMSLSAGMRTGLGVAGLAVGGAFAVAAEWQQGKMDYSNAEARKAKAFSDVALATRRGDMGYTTAMIDIMRDPNKRKDFMDIAGGKLAAGMGEYGSNISLSGQGLMNALTGGARAIENAPAAQMEKMRAMLENERTAGWEKQAFLAKVSAESVGRMGGMRALGVGEQGFSKIKEAAEARGMGSEFVGAGQALGGLIGRRAGTQGLFKVMNFMAGGLDAGAAASIVGANTLTGGSLGLLVGGATKGKDGLDIRGAGTIGGAVANAVLGGGGIVSGDALFSAMSSGLSGPGGVFEAKLRADSLAGTSTIMGGGGDPYGTGTSVLGAAQAFKDANVHGSPYGISALATAMKDPALVAQVMQSNVVPDNLAAYGITGNMFKQAYSSSLDAQFRGRMLNDPQDNSAQASFNRDVSKVGFSKVGTLKEKYGKQFLTLGANALMATGTAPDFAHARGAFGTLAGIGSAAGKKGGAGDAAYGSASHKAAIAASNDEKVHRGQLDDPAFSGDMDEALGAQKQFQKAFTGMTKMFTEADSAADKLNGLAQAADGLRGVFKDIAHMTGHDKDFEAAMRESQQAAAVKAAESKAAAASKPHAASEGVKANRPGGGGGDWHPPK